MSYFVATAYGEGSYFATTSEYSTDFCTDNGAKFMILAKVVTGRYMQGTPATERSNIPKGYHSTVDNVYNPNMFAVYHDASAYPEYVIQFYDASECE